MKVSAILSIHNRGRLLKRALWSYLWQTMSPKDFEVILVDDMSTCDLSHYYYDAVAGNLNFRHVTLNHTAHPIFKQRNPGWKPGDPEDWYHTPALSINAGIALARGEVICLCHPEVIHSPQSFDAGYDIAHTHKLFAFSPCALGTPETNEAIDALWDYRKLGWKGFKGAIEYKALQKWGPTELYWYSSFLPRAACIKVGGVDFAYLNGVAGEDDDFRDRVVLSGTPANWIPDIESVHQDHSDEMEPVHRRDTQRWREALVVNRGLYYGRRNSQKYPQPANVGFDWTAKECWVREVGYAPGSTSAHLLRYFK